MAARILSGNPGILKLPRDQTRADEMMKYLSINIKPLGFGGAFKGKECYTLMTNFILKYTGTDQPDMKKVTATLHAHQKKTRTDI